jgi:hypothetical protein
VSSLRRTLLGVLLALSWSSVTPRAEEGGNDEPMRFIFAPAETDEAAQDGSPVVGQPELPGSSGIPQSLLFDAPPDADSLPDEAMLPGSEPAWNARVEKLRLEAGWLPDGSDSVHGSDYAHGRLVVFGRPGEPWEWRLAARLDAYTQRGEPGFADADLDYGESWAALRTRTSRWTVGAQRVIWGRVDEIPPLDRLSVHDLRRFVLDPLRERRTAVPALRWEGFADEYKGDLLVVPWFRSPRMPSRESIWHPVDRRRGRIIGIEPTPASEAILRGARLDADQSGFGGAGLRVTRLGSGWDAGLSVQSARRSMPYYELDEAGLPAADASSPVRLTAVYPRTWVLGWDFALEALGATWRLETAYLSRFSVTDAAQARRVDGRAADWVAAVELFPGDTDAQVNLQLSGHNVWGVGEVLENKNAYLLTGRYEDSFAHGRWRLRLRFGIGLDRRDVYANPELTYLGREPYRLYMAAHWFDGADDTPGGFHKHHSLLTLGWRAEY